MDGPLEDLPIDVRLTSLVEWLAQRAKIVPDWSKRLVAIQTKASQCFKDLQPEVISQLKGGPDAPLDYLRAVEIRDLLTKTAERSLFGGLTGAAAEWDRIVKAYEKGGIHLGEAGLSMVQNAEYELPYLRKQAAKLRQQAEDAERRHAEYIKSAVGCATAYKEECKKLGITPGPDVQKQLTGLSKQLPACFETVLELLKSSHLDEGINYYWRFSAYAHNLPVDHQVLSTLREVKDKRTAPPALPVTPKPALTPNTGINWDTGPVEDTALQPAAAAPVAGGISWDVPATGGVAEGGGISWDLGDVMVETGEGGTQGEGVPVTEMSWDIGVDAKPAGTQAGTAVDWDIDMITAPEAQSGGIDWGIDIGGSEASTPPPPPALDSSVPPEVLSGSGAVVARFCADAEYRAAFSDDLMELRAFLMQRVGELSASSNALLLASMPEELQSVDAPAVKAMATAVESVLTALRGERLGQLLMLSGSTRYVERLAGALARKAGQESKMIAAAQGAVARGNEAKVQLVETAKKVVELVERTRAIKTHVDSALAGLFPGKRIQIMGDINAALASTTA